MLALAVAALLPERLKFGLQGLEAVRACLCAPFCLSSDRVGLFGTGIGHPHSPNDLGKL